MKGYFERISESKRDFRRRLAALPIAEKLRLLDSLRERMLAIRRGSNAVATRKTIVQETPSER
ncbi:MAG: hypothetical protein DME54_09560 [Verrucomicrobia bacterium]|nr:MAG: hypothetical protein DME62_06960 [Verrucomicrobiota bacterium]PYK34277.1 MAG: hypothetical protein DME54_09560 [Verrucomicrobiota bacterium]PYL80467.1 MAG: hypothetical protein DMF21_08760 [Verrucomicrobiota bacterium]